jgi:hypothetical protein
MEELSGRAVEEGDSTGEGQMDRAGEGSRGTQGVGLLEVDSEGLVGEDSRGTQGVGLPEVELVGEGSQGRGRLGDKALGQDSLEGLGEGTQDLWAVLGVAGGVGWEEPQLEQEKP